MFVLSLIVLKRLFAQLTNSHQYLYSTSMKLNLYFVISIYVLKNDARYRYSDFFSSTFNWMIFLIFLFFPPFFSFTFSASPSCNSGSISARICRRQPLLGADLLVPPSELSGSLDPLTAFLTPTTSSSICPPKWV